jgi:hypothetical protein
MHREPEGPPPPPIICLACELGWDDTSAFLPARHLELDGHWPSLCVDCFVARQPVGRAGA